MGIATPEQVILSFFENQAEQDKEIKQLNNVLHSLSLVPDSRSLPFLSFCLGFSK